MNLMRRALFLSLIVLHGFLVSAFAAVEPAREFQVEYRRLFRNDVGRLVLDSVGVRFEGRRQLQWQYSQIRQIRLGRRAIEVRTYEDDSLRLGKDRDYSFKVLEGEVDGLLAAQLRGLMGGILVSSLEDWTDPPLYQASVKRVRGWWGEEGTLEIGEQGIRYRSSRPDRSRSWSFDQIVSFAQPSRREFELVAEELGSIDSHRTFRFQLKSPLPASIYAFLWPRIHSTVGYPLAAAPERPR